MIISPLFEVASEVPFFRAFLFFVLDLSGSALGCVCAEIKVSRFYIKRFKILDGKYELEISVVSIDSVLAIVSNSSYLLCVIFSLHH